MIFVCVGGEIRTESDGGDGSASVELEDRWDRHVCRLLSGW